MGAPESVEVDAQWLGKHLDMFHLLMERVNRAHEALIDAWDASTIEDARRAVKKVLDEDCAGVFLCRTEKQWGRIGCAPFDSVRGDPVPPAAVEWEARRS